MKDIKYKTELCGLHGANCILCTTKQNDWLQTDNISAGFPINRTASENMQLYIALAVNGEIQKKRDDFDVRKGLTQMPMTISDQRSITVTHSYINGSKWFIKFLGRVITCVKKWSLKEKSPQEILVGHANTKILKEIKEGADITMEKLNSGGHSGTTTTGNTGRKFFSQKLVPVVEKLIGDEAVRQTVLTLHLKLSIVLRVISSNELINMDEYEKLVKEIGILLAEKFSWAKLNFTLHASLHHSAELMKDNDCRGLGSLSEEALESNNNDLRIFMESFSRKFSGEYQLRDVLLRALE